MLRHTMLARSAAAIVLLATLTLPCLAAQTVVDFCNPATGVLESVAYDAPSLPRQCVPVAPWILSNPQVRAQLARQPKPPNVDNPPFLATRATRQLPPATGVRRILVLPVDFSDNPAQLYPGDQSRVHFTKLLFSKGVYPTGSMRDWYQEVSYKAFDLVGSIVGGATGWFRAPHTYAYYADNQRGFGASPHNSYQLAIDVLALADPLVDFRRYDNDGDGMVDGVFIVHAGPGYETTGNLQNLHSCTLGFGTQVWKDGMQIPAAIIAPEDGKIGVFGHEFGHVLNLPDLYDTDYDSAGIGNFSMMASGTWGGGGDRPVHFDAFCKESLGWTHPTVVTTTKLAAAVPQAETSAIAYKLWTAGQMVSEYFLVENRQRVGFDASLPAAGLLIWHIDHTGDNNHQWFPPWSGPWHYQVALEQADGLFDMEHNANAGDPDDAFPGLLNHRAFNAYTTPSSNSYEDGNTHVTVSTISNSGPRMTADLSVVNRPPDRPTRLTVTPSAPVATSVLTAKATATTDPDGDPCTYAYAWSKWTGYVWGPWGHGSANGRLTGVTLKAGDQWMARVRVGDGVLYGLVRYSPSVSVGAAPKGALTVAAAAAPSGARGAAITVNLSSPAAVEVEIRNLSGRLVGMLAPQELSAGVSNLLWNGSSVNGTAVPGGTYLLKIVARGSAGAQAQALANLAVRP